MSLTTLVLSLLPALVPAADQAPEAILHANFPARGQPGVLRLSWRATSSHPNATIHSVSLQWAEADCPWRWHPIGPAAMANTGRYSWPVPAVIPDKVYLRLTVRDSDGHVAVTQTLAVRLPLRR